MNAAKYAEQEAYDRERARIWLQDLLGLDVQSDFFSELGDGVLLCSIVNTIKPGTIKKVNSASKAKKLVAKRLENLNAFLFGCKRIGVYPSYQFEIQEFQERKREDKLIRCLLKLEEIARKAGIDPTKYGEIHIGSDEPAPASPAVPVREKETTPVAPASPSAPVRVSVKDTEAEDRERKEREQREREQREREERERAQREKLEREKEEKEREESEREEREREERERKEHEREEREAEEARIKREKDETERREREEREERERREAEEREEREERERAEKERKERQKQEAEKERLDREKREAEEKSAREAKLRAEREAREKALKEEREKREREEREKREKEEKAKKEREEKLRRDREQREKERKEREEKEKQEKEKRAGASADGGLKSKLDIFGGAALKSPKPAGSTSPKPPTSPSTAAPEGGNARAFFSQLSGGEPAKTSGGGKITLAPGKKLTGTDALLYWAQTNTSSYSGVDITNFTESWKDGLGFCALVHAHFPAEIDFNACVSKTPSERLELAFDAAGRMGVPPLLDPEDITDVKSVDARSLITYLGCLYKGFKR